MQCLIIKSLPAVKFIVLMSNLFDYSNLFCIINIMLRAISEIGSIRPKQWINHHAA